MEHVEDLRTASSESFNFSQRSVEVKVGRRFFYVHPNVLRQASEHFRELIPINGHNHEQRIDLPDVEPEVFNAYLHLHYFGKIPCRQPDEPVSERTEDFISTDYDLLCDLHIFADYVRDRKAMDAAISALLSRYTQRGPEDGLRVLPSDQRVNKVYAETKLDSPLRRLMVDMHMCGNEQALVGGPDALDGDFIYDLALVLLRERGKAHSKDDSLPKGVSICDYHKPGDCEACVGRKRKRGD
ncbi:hypothetical protein LTR65_006686 [Meristemomyces frigidus]